MRQWLNLSLVVVGVSGFLGAIYVLLRMFTTDFVSQQMISAEAKVLWALLALIALAAAAVGASGLVKGRSSRPVSEAKPTRA